MRCGVFGIACLWGFVRGVCMYARCFFFLFGGNTNQTNVHNHIITYQPAHVTLIDPTLIPNQPLSHMIPGDHVLLSSYDRRVVWFDLDLASTPYRTLKYHTKVTKLIDL